MPPIFITKLSDMAHTPAEAAIVPKIFKKAGIAPDETRTSHARWFLMYRPLDSQKGTDGPELREGNGESGRKLRDGLVKGILPVIDSADVSGIQENAAKLSKGCESAGKGLKRWGVAARLEHWAGGAIAAASLLANPGACLRMLADGTKGADDAHILITFAGAAITGLALWARMRLSEAREGVLQLSENASFIANKILPADGQARELYEDAEAYRVLVSKRSSDVVEIAAKLHASRKIAQLCIGKATLAVESAKIGEAIAINERLSVFAKDADKKSLELYSRREKLRSCEGKMSSSGAAYSDAAYKSLLQSETQRLFINAGVQSSESAFKPILPERHAKVHREDAFLVEVFSHLADFYANNFKVQKWAEAEMALPDRMSLKVATRLSAIRSSEQAIAKTAGELRAYLELGLRDSRIIDSYAKSLIATSAVYSKAIESGDLDVLGFAMQSNMAFTRNIVTVIRDAAQQN